jgi:hypothetical protein
MGLKSPGLSTLVGQFVYHVCSPVLYNSQKAVHDLSGEAMHDKLKEEHWFPTLVSQLNEGTWELKRSLESPVLFIPLPPNSTHVSQGSC